MNALGPTSDPGNREHSCLQIIRGLSNGFRGVKSELQVGIGDPEKGFVVVVSSSAIGEECLGVGLRRGQSVMEIRILCALYGESSGCRQACCGFLQLQL